MKHGGIGQHKPSLMRVIFALLNIFLVLVLIASINFVIFRVDVPDRAFIPKGLGPEAIDALTEEFRLDDNVVLQYFDYLAKTFTGDFYKSTVCRPGHEVDSLVYHAAIRTLFLFAVVSAVSIPLGAVWGCKSGKNASDWRGKLLHIIAVSSFVFPLLVLICYLMLASDRLGLDLPVRGDGFSDGTVSAIQHVILPALALIIPGSAFVALVTRSGALRGKRFGDHPSPLSSMGHSDPFAYYFFPLAMATVITAEIVFQYHGLGRLMLDGWYHYDLPVVMACVFVISVIVFSFQLLFRAVRERRRFMLSAESILGPLRKGDTKGADASRLEPRASLSVSEVLACFKRVGRSYAKNRSGVVAAVILMVILLLGLFAGVLSTVPNPDYPANREYAVPSANWYNPLPPSLSPSPFTGLLHPLGTDQMGIDLYSLNLYAAWDGISLVIWIAAVSVICGLAVGFLSIVKSHHVGCSSRMVGRVMAVVSQSLLAISPPVILLIYRTHDVYFVSPGLLVVLLIYGCVYRTITWPLSDSLQGVIHKRGWREFGKSLTSSLRVLRCRVFLVLSRTLHVTKYVIVLMIALQWGFSWFHTFGSYLFAGWYDIIESAYFYGAFLGGYTWWIVPPVLGIIALAVCSYICISTLEEVFDEEASRAPSAKP